MAASMSRSEHASRGRASHVARTLGVAAASLCALALRPVPLRAEPTVTVLPLGFKVEEFRGPNSYFARTLPTSPVLAEKLSLERPLVAVWGEAGGAAFHLDQGELKQIPFASRPAEGAPLQEAPRKAIASSRMQTAGPITVFLSGPRSDYRHAVLGDAVEAGEVTIIEKQALTGVSSQPRSVPTKVATVSSGSDAVFEDLEPRLVDLDQDGTPEILVVKSYLDKGAALAVIGKRDGEWRIVAETPPIGEAQRWLNPAAVSDFDGDGKPDIALVRTPHLTGVLQIWAWSEGKLALKHQAEGYANHAIGSTTLDNAAAVDTDGDGRPELVVPTLDRRSIAILSVKGGIKELARVALPGRVERGVAALGSGKDAHILAALDDGRLVLVKP